MKTENKIELKVNLITLGIAALAAIFAVYQVIKDVWYTFFIVVSGFAFIIILAVKLSEWR